METIRKFDFDTGEVLLIDKPYQWTSFDVIKKLRNTIRIKKIGHAGTLDPLATGLLIVCTGKFTKKINEFQDQGKVYTGIIEIGKTTPSYDLETEFDSETAFDKISNEDLDAAVKPLIGNISQLPPVFSAIKIGGERAYKKARRNEEVKMPPREVSVNEFTFTKIELPEIHFEIKCSKGTYIRSLAHDLGQNLGCGAHLKALKRTAIGDFNVQDAYSLDEFIEISKESIEVRNKSKE
jgi:tRNA pseudouridine55 synthase